MDFEQLYITWYSRLKFFAREYVLSDADAENIVQDIFTDLYEKREVLEIPVNMVAYLFTATDVSIIFTVRYWSRKPVNGCRMNTA